MKVLATQLLDDGRRKKSILENLEQEPGSPAANQIKTKTLFTGVTNGTERNDLIGGNYAHPDEALPATWGYQNVGEVIEVGSDVTKLQHGDMIFSSCGHSEYTLFDEDFLYCKIPDSVELQEASLFGMTSVAMRTCRNAEIKVGEKVLVVGAGIIGQTAAQIANVMGASVTICDINRKRLDLALEINAAEFVLNVTGGHWDELITDFTYDVILDFAGVPGMIDSMIKAAKMWGRLMLIAGRDQISYDFNTGQQHEITIKQNSHFDNSDLENLSRHGCKKTSPDQTLHQRCHSCGTGRIDLQQTKRYT